MYDIGQWELVDAVNESVKLRYGEDEQLDVSTEDILNVYRSQPRNVETRDDYCLQADINTIGDHVLMKAYKRQFGGWAPPGAKGWKELYYTCIVEKSENEWGQYPPPRQTCSECGVNRCYYNTPHSPCIVCGSSLTDT